MIKVIASGMIALCAALVASASLAAAPDVDIMLIPPDGEQHFEFTELTETAAGLAQIDLTGLEPREASSEPGMKGLSPESTFRLMNSAKASSMGDLIAPGHPLQIPIRI